MESLDSRVVVVAVTGPAVGALAAALRDAGATVALVANVAGAHADVAVHFRADPSNPAVWDRVSMHVEQHLGPVDAVVTDPGAATHARSVFGADLRRRGRGDVVVVDPRDEPSDVVRKVLDTQ